MSSASVQRVFVSYAREDLEWAQQQALTLADARIHVFIDMESLRTGDDWPERMRAEIAQADQVRLGWSRYAAQSEWVRREYEETLEVARTRGDAGLLLIYLIDDTPLHAALQHIQAEAWPYATPDVDRLLNNPYRELPLEAPPSMLLRSEFKVVPFYGRDEILREIFAWCESGKRFDTVLYVGPGGTGKTRLFSHVCAKLQGNGWDTGFLDSPRTRDMLRAAPERLDKLLYPRRPRLVVVDYAESRRDEVEAILHRAVGLRDGHPVRLVLLARAAGGWWGEVRQASPYFAILLGGSTEPRLLPPLTPTLEERQASFHAALRAFAARLGTAVPGQVQVDLESPFLRQALFLHLKALLAVLEHDASRSGGLADLLDHEERYWAKVAEDEQLGRTLRRELAPAVALVTVVGGVAAGDELDGLLARAPRLEKRDPGERQAIGTVLARVYGWEGRVEALQPDRLGEELVAREIERNPDLLHAWTTEGDSRQLRQGLTVLSRMADYRKEALGWLMKLLTPYLRPMAQEMVKRAFEGGYTLPRMFAESFQPELDLTLVRDPKSQHPWYMAILRRVALLLTRKAVAAVAPDAARAHRLDDARQDELLAVLAQGLDDRAADLDGMGYGTDGLVAELADRFRSLAASLRMLEYHLGDPERWNEALVEAGEVARVHRRLESVHPGVLEPGLTDILRGLGTLLADLFNPDERRGEAVPSNPNLPADAFSGGVT